MDHQDVYLAADELCRQLGEAIEALLGPAHLQENVLSFHIAKVVQPVPECFEGSEPRLLGLADFAEEPNPRDLRAWLRLGGEQGDEQGDGY
jgi:hypothetical protein